MDISALLKPTKSYKQYKKPLNILALMLVVIMGGLFVFMAGGTQEGSRLASVFDQLSVVRFDLQGEGCEKGGSEGTCIITSGDKEMTLRDCSQESCQASWFEKGKETGQGSYLLSYSEAMQGVTILTVYEVTEDLEQRQQGQYFSLEVKDPRAENENQEFKQAEAKFK